MRRPSGTFSASAPAYPSTGILADRAGTKVAEPLRVPCYDTTLLIDDLHLPTHAEGRPPSSPRRPASATSTGTAPSRSKSAAAPVTCPLKKATAATSPSSALSVPPSALMPQSSSTPTTAITLNIAKHILSETAGCNLFWLEEAFHEDDELYEDLHAWIEREGLSVLIADGEGAASPHLLDYARRGIVDVIQYDIFSYGLTKWLQTAPKLRRLERPHRPTPLRTAPGQLRLRPPRSRRRKLRLRRMGRTLHARPGHSVYAVDEGLVTLPDAPGFGLKLDESLFHHAVKENGFVVKSD